MPENPLETGARLILDLRTLVPRRTPGLATMVGKALAALEGWGLTRIETVDRQADLPVSRAWLDRGGQRSASLWTADGRVEAKVHKLGDGVSLSVRGPASTDLDRLRAVRDRWLAAWPSTAAPPLDQLVRIVGHKRRRPLPPRVGFSADVLLHWFDERCVDGRWGAGTWARLCSRPVPPAVQRTVQGGVLSVAWVTGAHDPELDARLLASDVWAGQALRLTRSPEYLANGDLLHQVVRGEAAPFDFWCGGTSWGHVRLAPDFQDGDLAPHLAALRAGRTPSGHGVRGVVAVFEARQDAWDQHKRLRGLGVRRVVYALPDGRLANPHPPGRWKDIHDWWDADHADGNEKAG